MPSDPIRSNFRKHYVLSDPFSPLEVRSLPDEKQAAMNETPIYLIPGAFA